jgi:uncharacterized membrane protein
MGTIQSYYLPPERTERHKKSRIFEVDFLRGFAIFLMIALHGCCAFEEVGPGLLIAPPSGEGNPAWIQKTIDFTSGVFNLIDYGNLWILEFFFSSLFMLLCGISCSFSSSNLQRGLKLASLSLGMTILLEIADRLIGLNLHIYIGILHSMSIAILLYALVDRFFKSYWVDYGIGIAFALLDIVISYYCYSMDGQIIHFTEAEIPSEWWKMLIGIGRAGDDYFSPVNTCAFVFLGATIGKTLYRNKQSLLRNDFPTAWAKPILWCGSNSLLIYALHMPFFYFLLSLIYFPFGYRMQF